MLDDLTPAQERFAEWLATPLGDRKPRRFEDFASELGVSQPTLYRWRKRPDVRARAQEIVDEAVGGPERVRMVLEKIAEQAMAGSAKQQELFLRYAGLLVDRRVTEKIVTLDTEEMSDEELEEAWAAEQAESQADWDSEAEAIFDANDLNDLESGGDT
jgi:transposase-like protein